MKELENKMTVFEKIGENYKKKVAARMKERVKAKIIEEEELQEEKLPIPAEVKQGTGRRCA